MVGPATLPGSISGANVDFLSRSAITRSQRQLTGTCAATPVHVLSFCLRTAAFQHLLQRLLLLTDTCQLSLAPRSAFRPFANSIQPIRPPLTSPFAYHLLFAGLPALLHVQRPLDSPLVQLSWSSRSHPLPPSSTSHLPPAPSAAHNHCS